MAFHTSPSFDLQKYAGVGRTIVCTIHQPSSQLFALFDYICIMAEGKCVFLGESKDCFQIFANAGFPTPENYNPFDHYIFTLAVVPGREMQCKAKVSKVSVVVVVVDVVVVYYCCCCCLLLFLCCSVVVFIRGLMIQCKDNRKDIFSLK